MKKALSLILALALCLAVAVPVLAELPGYGDELYTGEKTYTQTFSDVPENHWAFAYIAEMAERRAVTGYPDGLYRPENNVTRAEFAKIMLGAAGLTAQPAAASSFSDVPLTHWASPFVETAKPYLTAYRDGTFRPDVHALREDIAVAVVKLKGYDTRLADLALLNAMFSDVAAISEPLRPYIALAVEDGLISGYPDGTFGPQGQITRAEVAAILWRAFQYGNDDKVIADELPEQTEAPQPTATQKPTPKPENLYVDTVQALPRGASEYVYTKSGDIYYIKDSKLFLQSGGQTTQLYDGNVGGDFYEEYTGAEIREMLKDETTGARTFSRNALDKVPENKQFYFDQLTLAYLTYDEMNDKVYVCGTTNLVYAFHDLDDYYAYLQKILDVTDMSASLWTWTDARSGYSYGPRPIYKEYYYLYCFDGVLHFSWYGDQMLNPTTGNILTFSGTNLFLYFDGGPYFTWNGKIMGIDRRSDDLYQYDISKGIWVKMDVDEEFTNGSIYYGSLQGYGNRIYFTGKYHHTIYALAQSERYGGRLERVWELDKDVIEIRDIVPISDIVSFQISLSVDGEIESILFADEEHMLLRKIIFT